jgi:hypothetical protein
VEQIEVAEAAKKSIGNLPVEPLKNKGLEDTNEGRRIFIRLFFVSRSTAGTNAIDSVLAMKKQVMYQ